MTLGNINLRLILVVPIIFFLFFFVHNLQASDYVSSVRSYQEGKNIVITYALSKQSDIAVSVSTDGGRTYKALISVYGDVGNMIKPGSEKIVWDVLSEYENFKFFEVCFKVESNFYNGHEYVDLGLPSGTLWATCNVGASKPEEYGDYFAWGETQTKYNYNWSIYKWCNGSHTTQTKYCTDSSIGKFDNKKVLDLTDDVANANWGGYWRMPTTTEHYELFEECIWTNITQNGVRGYKVSSKKNGNSIFLPYAGFRNGTDLVELGSSGYYWSSSLYVKTSYCSCYMGLDYDDVGWTYGGRCFGLSVRPVLNK